jgi:prepilin-type N-terminal cleavage/methylation domain-containing protein
MIKKRNKNFRFTPFRDPIKFTRSEPYLILESRGNKKLGNKKSLTGFTLIELLVVISVIGFIASVLIVKFHTAKLANADVIRFQDNAKYPTSTYVAGNLQFAFDNMPQWDGELGPQLQQYMSSFPKPVGVQDGLSYDDGYGFITIYDTGHSMYMYVFQNKQLLSVTKSDMVTFDHWVCMNAGSYLLSTWVDTKPEWINGWFAGAGLNGQQIWTNSYAFGGSITDPYTGPIASCR